jgi:hypothetical protein
MVDLVIAANFARELTAEQFEHERQLQRRRAAASRAAQASDATPRVSGHKEPTRIGRAFARLVQVRG